MEVIATAHSELADQAARSPIRVRKSGRLHGHARGHLEPQALGLDRPDELLPVTEVDARRQAWMPCADDRCDPGERNRRGAMASDDLQALAGRRAVQERGVGERQLIQGSGCDVEDGFKQAKATGKPIMLYFTADW